MRLIGVLGGTSWPSTIPPYRLLNEEVQRRCGTSHSARIALYSIDYHEIRTRYSGDWSEIPALLLQETRTLLSFRPDCWMIANNTLHKLYDQIADQLPSTPPMFHAVALVRDHLANNGIGKVLLLGTQFTMEDGYFAEPLRSTGAEVIVPGAVDREQIGVILTRLADGETPEAFRGYFAELIARAAAKGCEAVVLGCTELPLAISQADARLPLIDPLVLQCSACVDYALAS